MFFYLLFLAHIQAVLIPIFLGIKSINQFKNVKKHTLIPFGFVFLGFASKFEMIDHTKTDWIYINHSSLFNWLFYSFIALGLACLTVPFTKNKFVKWTTIFSSFGSIVSYFLIDKSISLSFQVIISILLIVSWQRTFKDWILIAYPIFGIFLTTFFGANLSITGNQIWHVLIGPSGTISVLTFYLILKRSKKKFPEIL